MESRNGMLYPMMVIAAISVILFSIIGIATMTGHIPSALSQKGDEVAQAQAEKDALSAKEAEAAKLAEAEKAQAAKEAETAKLAEAEKAQAAKAASSHPNNTVAERHPAPAPQRTAVVCNSCGVVESVQAQETKGQGSGLGAVGGAVVGGVLGHQVGGGRGKDLATVAGAIGGGFAGNEVEKNVKKTTSYVIRVRMEDGTYRTITQASQPAVAAGDRVRIENGNVVARG